MSIPLPILDDDTLLIDNSSLEVGCTCHRAMEYYFCRKRQTASERSALRFGGIIHKALDLRYRAASPMHAQSPAVESVMLASLDNDFSAWQPPEDDFRTHSFAVELINKYGIAYPFESFEVVRLPDGSPFVEVPFAIPLGEVEINSDVTVLLPSGGTATRHVTTLKIVWTGKIDLAYVNDGRYYILDHKTTSMMGPSFFQDFELSHPMHGYCWAAEQLLGKPIYGYVINALATRKPTKTGKALEFERKVYHLSRPHLDEWKTDTLHIVTDIVSSAVRGYMPKMTKWCVGKYGTCQFHKVCTLPPEQRDFMLGSGEYEQVVWSPLKKED